MNDDMSERYRIFRRASGLWYLEERESKHQSSLRTRDEEEAQRLLHAKNEAERLPAINIQIARAYLAASDPKLVTRTWQEVMDAAAALKRGPNRDRWNRATKDTHFASLRALPLIQTRAEHFIKVLEEGTVSTNVFLRRIHNLAIDMDWLLKPVIPKANWPKVCHKTKRAITLEEHLRIIEAEAAAAKRNQGSRNSGEPHYLERLNFYKLCWHLGGSQTDVACLTAEDVEWSDKTICYERKKLDNHGSRDIKPPIIRFGQADEEILRSLPQSGPLFPYLRSVDCKDRATEFRQRCEGLGIKGVSLHCYRYAWAERARKAGYPERFAQEALGHNSKAVHRAYAKKAQVIIDSLEVWEQNMQHKVVKVQFQSSAKAEIGSNDGERQAVVPEEEKKCVI